MRYEISSYLGLQQESNITMQSLFQSRGGRCTVCQAVSAMPLWRQFWDTKCGLHVLT